MVPLRINQSIYPSLTIRSNISSNRAFPAGSGTCPLPAYGPVHELQKGQIITMLSESQSLK